MTTPFLDESIALLERTPLLVHDLLDGLPDGWLGVPDAPGGWTARDVVGHLISNELDNFIPRAEMILTHGTSRPFPPFDRFAHVERDRGVPLPDLIQRFADLRASNIIRLRKLVRNESELDRHGIHPSLGDVTLRQLIATWTVHDLDHVAQIYAALSGARQVEVGPWKANLGILLRRVEQSS